MNLIKSNQIFCCTLLYPAMQKETNMAVASVMTCKIGLIWRHTKTLYNYSDSICAYSVCFQELYYPPPCVYPPQLIAQQLIVTPSLHHTWLIHLFIFMNKPCTQCSRVAWHLQIGGREKRVPNLLIAWTSFFFCFCFNLDIDYMQRCHLSAIIEL